MKKKDLIKTNLSKNYLERYHCTIKKRKFKRIYVNFSQRRKTKSFMNHKCMLLKQINQDDENGYNHFKAEVK